MVSRSVVTSSRNEKKKNQKSQLKRNRRRGKRAKSIRKVVSPTAAPPPSFLFGLRNRMMREESFCGRDGWNAWTFWMSGGDHPIISLYKHTRNKPSGLWNRWGWAIDCAFNNTYPNPLHIRKKVPCNNDVYNASGNLNYLN